MQTPMEAAPAPVTHNAYRAKAQPSFIKRKGRSVSPIFHKRKIGMERSPFRRGAEDEIRTRDVHLGKVTLYH